MRHFLLFVELCLGWLDLAFLLASEVSNSHEGGGEIVKDFGYLDHRTRRVGYTFAATVRTECGSVSPPPQGDWCAHWVVFMDTPWSGKQ